MTVHADTSLQLRRLEKAREWSFGRMKSFRRVRRAAYEQYVGFHYGESAARDKVPVGLVAMMIDVYLRSTVARKPKILVTTEDGNLKSEAATIEADINVWIEDLNLQRSIRAVVMDAILSLGILKVGLEDSGSAELNGERVGATKPFAVPVHLDHLVLDMAADSWREMDFIGNRYKVPIETAHNTDYWDKTVRESLGRSTSGESASGGFADDYDLHSIGVGGEMEPDEYEERVEVWDIWLPREQKVVTMPSDQTGRILNVVEWDGPENGPYHELGFKWIPGNVMPLAPVLNSALDLHELVNAIYNKLGRQIDREKVILGYRGNSKDDAERIVRSNDGHAVLQNDGQLNELRFGGINPASMAFMLQSKDLFSWIGGNIDSLGGLSPQADTLGQEQLLAGSANKMIADMQDAVLDFTKSAVDSLRWYHWTDPLRQSKPIKRIAGTDLRIESFWSPETRRGNYLDYKYDVDVYSMQHQTPQTRLQAIMQVVQQVIFPAMPMLQQQGMGVDMQQLISLFARYLDIPELKDVVTAPGSIETSKSAGSPLSEGASKSPVSYRNYTRRNAPQSQQASTNEAVQSLLAAGRDNNVRGGAAA